MKTENRIIAEFVGGNKSPISGAWRLTDEGRLYMDNDLSYHSSLDWLMPSCRKFCSLLKNTKFETFNMEVAANVARGEIERAIWNYLYEEGEIIDVYNALVKGIKFYNTQKTTAYTSDNISTSSDIDKVK